MYFHSISFTLTRNNKDEHLLEFSVAMKNYRNTNITTAHLLQYAVGLFLKGFDNKLHFVVKYNFCSPIEHRKAEAFCHVDYLSRSSTKAKTWNTDTFIDYEIRNLRSLINI